MKILAFASAWTFGDVAACRREVDGGFFDGIEGPPPSSLSGAREFGRALANDGVPLIAEVCTGGSYAPASSVTFDTHLEQFREQAERGAAASPLFLNCLVGSDSWPAAKSVDFLGRVLEIGRDLGVELSFETHRSRPTFHPWLTSELLRALPDLRLTCDFSHWCVVCERLVDDEAALELAITRARHFHARVGYAQVHRSLTRAPPSTRPSSRCTRAGGVVSRARRSSATLAGCRSRRSSAPTVISSTRRLRTHLSPTSAKSIAGWRPDNATVSARCTQARVRREAFPSLHPLQKKRPNMSLIIKTITLCGFVLALDACKEAPAAQADATKPAVSASAEAAAMPAPTTTPSSGVKLHIAYSDWPGFVAWEVALKKGWFKEAGVDVEFHWFDYVPSMDAYNAGKVDAVGLTNGDQLVIAASGNKSQAIILTDYSDGNDMIVAKAGIKKVADLKGKKIGVEVGFVDHLLLLYALKASNLAEKDVTLVNVPTDQTPTALKSGKVDAIGAWQPSSGTALREVAGSSPIFTSADVPGLIYDMFVVSPKSLAEHRAEWLKVVGVWDRVAKFVTDPANADEAATIMSARVGLTPEAYKPLMKGTHILTLSAAQKAFEKAPGLTSVFGSSKVADDFNVKNAVYKVSQDPNSYLDPTLTSAAMK